MDKDARIHELEWTLRKIIKEYDGNILPWELAEFFNVTEDFMRKALEYYFGD